VAESEIRTEVQELNLQWLRDYAWPLWLERGVDWNCGAFHEHLDLASLQCAADFRRLRVASRQTYVFANAETFGVARAGDAVALGLEFLRGPARGQDGGFALRFDLNNRPIDLTRHLYDHAFVLLAFSAVAAVAGPNSTRKDALAVLDFITRVFPHPAGGYEESVPPTRPRRQNPHMHLLEALLAANDAFGDRVFFDLAHDLIELFLDRLFQPNLGAIPEFFDDDLAPIREGTRFLVEPGHHFEWIWLLDWYAKTAAAMGRTTPPQLGAAVGSLLRFADCYGIDHKTGLVVDAIWSDGALASAGFRLWPQTERLKVEARRDDGPRRLSIALAALSRHFDGARPGLWFERIAADGTVVRDPAPATSLYHLTAALTDAVVLLHGRGGKSRCC
jgi:mannose/cellobiose epimerase-like protein (N-acyl-D-glucosamine 2-epimerase family)